MDGSRYREEGILTEEIITHYYGRLPSGEYRVSEADYEVFVVKKGLENLANGSYFAFRDHAREEWRRTPIESGKVKIDQHGNSYTIKLRVEAGGGYYEYGYEGELRVVEIAN